MSIAPRSQNTSAVSRFKLGDFSRAPRFGGEVSGDSFGSPDAKLARFGFPR